MRLLRRLLRYLMMTVAVVLILVLLAIGVTQTGWFKDWLRRYIVREAAQYLHGELHIGRLSGSLFYGIRLSDITLVQQGESIIALKDLRVDYSAFRLAASGIILDEIELNQPRVVARRTSEGWNLMRLVKRQARERERTGPARPITLPSIVIHDGQVTVDRGPQTKVMRVDDLDVQAGFAYQPVNFTVDIGNISFRATDPAIALNKMSGRVAVAGDDINVDQLYIRLPETELKLDGVVRDYKKAPRYDFAVASSKVTFPEIGVLLPAVRNMAPQPSFQIKTSGPLDRLEAVVDIRSANAGTVQGTVLLVDTITGKGRRRLQGDVQVGQLNLAPWLKNENLDGSITGRARFDLQLPDAGKKLPFAGTYHFTGPAAGAFGYAGADVDARGRFEGGRIHVEQARAKAYGAAATTAGTIDLTNTKAVAYDLKGRVSNVDLRRVPKQVPVPRLESRLDLDYVVSGRGRDFTSTALLHPSTVEGARIAEGTRGMFELKGREIRYGGDGQITNVDLQRFGRALDIDALAGERFEGVVNGRFRLDASGRSLSELVLKADGVATDTMLFGAQFPDMAIDATIDRGALAATAKGAFAGFNPRRLIENDRLAGELTGVVDGRFTLDDLRQDITFETFGYDGTLQVKDSTLFDLSLASAFFDGAIDNARATVRQLTVEGPDVAGTASGTMALDRTPAATSPASDLTYRFTVPDLARLGKRIERPISGSAELGGKLTGNLASLVATGTAHVKALRYADAAEAAVTDTTYTVTLPDLDVDNVRVKAHVEATDIAMPPATEENPDASRRIAKLTGDVTYANREAVFDARAIEGPRTIDAGGRALLQEGRQEVHLSKLALTAQGVTWQTGSSSAGGGGEALIVHDGQTVHITNLTLVNGQQQVTANGVVGVAEGTASTLKIVAEGLDLAQLEQLTGEPEPRLAGRLSTTATVSGNLREQPAVDGQFTITDGAFRNVKYQRLGGRASYDRRRISLDVQLVQSPGTELTAKGTLPLSLLQGGEAAKATGPEEAVDLHVQSTPIDLGLVQGLTTALTNVTGIVRLDMHAKGSGRNIAFDGFVNVEGGAFTVAPTGAVYTGLNTTLHFEPSRLVIQGLHVLDDGNDPLEVTGVLGLTGTQLGALDLTAKAQRFEVMDNDLGEVDVNMDLRVRGELAEPRIAGTIAIDRGRIEVDRLLRRLTTRAYATESRAELPPAAGLRESAAPSAPAPAPAPPVKQPPIPPPPSQTPPPSTPTGQTPVAPATDADKAKPAAPASFLSRVHSDVRVTIPDNMILRGKNLRMGAASMGLGNINVTVGGDLRLLRQPGAPMVVAGTVNTVRGSYDFRGRQFEILRDGRIAFQGADVDNPALDVTAQRVIEPSGVEARIRIQGTPRRPQLTFTSNPPMDESDVIALIVFNRPLSDLESGERSSIAEMAGSTAAGFLVSPLADSLSRALDLDLFEVGATNDPSGTGGIVTVGKQIDENLFFKFRQQFGGQEVSEFILEYQLARFLRVQAQVAEGEGVGRAQRSLTRRIERGGLDLIFYFSY